MPLDRAAHVALAELLTSLASPALATGRLLNAAGLSLRKWEITAAISVSASRENGYALEAMAVNLGFAIAHRETHRNSSSIYVNIEVNPAPFPRL